MTWHAVVIAVVWWSSVWSGCLPIPVSVPAPNSAAVVPPDHWAYGALADLAAAGWVIPNTAAGSGTRTRADFTAIALRLVSTAAAREQAGARSAGNPPTSGVPGDASQGGGREEGHGGDRSTATSGSQGLPMAQWILVARLVAEFQPVVPPANAARLPGLHPEEVPSPNGSRLARFVPTPLGAEIVVVEKATQKQTPIAVEGYNYAPAWSDDGDEVAWLRFTEGRTEVWVHSMITGDEHVAGSALADGWGKLTPVKDGFTLHLPGRPDRLVRIPALLEPENGAGQPAAPSPGPAK